MKEMESADGDDRSGKDLIVTRGNNPTDGVLVRSVCEKATRASVLIYNAKKGITNS